jgi:branched-chain amino acid transport system permease protein
VQSFIGFTIAGISLGAIYAIAASGLVVTYTTSGVFNFAHGAIGMLMAFVYWQLRVHQHLPAPVATFLVLFIAAPLLGAAIERVLIRKLDINDTGTTIVITLGLMVFLMGIATRLWPATSSRALPHLFGLQRHISLAGNRITYDKITAIVVALLVALFLRLLFYRLRVGVAMRAVVDDRDLTALNGAIPARISMLSWAIGASLGGLAGILQASSGGLDVINLTFLVVNSFAAAMLGRLKSLPMTFVGALVLGLSSSYLIGYLQPKGFFQNLVPSLPTLFLFLILVFLPPARLRAGTQTRTRQPRIPGRIESAVGAGLFVVATAVVVNLLQGTNLLAMAQGISIGIFGLSLVLLTGYGGQVSLCQYSFVGVGAYLFARYGGAGSPLTLLLVAAVGAALGAIIALPALRLKHLYLALATLAFARLADYMFFQQQSVLGRRSMPVHRLSLPLFSVKGDRANVIMLAVVFSVLALMVLAIRRGPFGRLLSAVKDSEAACATLGLNLTTTKVAVFSLSTAMAAVGGALYGASEGTINQNLFLYNLSLFLLLIVVVWGIKTPSAAVLGGLAYATVTVIIEPHLPSAWQQPLPYLLTGWGAIALGRNPNGVIGDLSARVADLRERLGRQQPAGGGTGGAVALRASRNGAAAATPATAGATGYQTDEGVPVVASAD